MDASKVFDLVGKASYVALAAVALWGAYYLLVLSLVGRKRFKTEEAQDAFLDSIEADLKRGDFDSVVQACNGAQRALPILVSFACKNRIFGLNKARQMTAIGLSIAIPLVMCTALITNRIQQMQDLIPSGLAR